MDRLRGTPAEASERLAGAWPVVSLQLTRALRRWGADSQSAQDIVQEVAVRALVRRVAFERAHDLLPWALVVGRRVLIDAYRARHAVEQWDFDRADWLDVERVVLGRLELERVWTASAELTAADRAALVTEAVPAPDRQTQLARAHQRFQARARLLRLVEVA